MKFDKLTMSEYFARLVLAHPEPVDQPPRFALLRDRRSFSEGGRMSIRRSIVTVADYSDWMSRRLFALSTAAVAALMSASPLAQAPARSIGGVLDTLDRVRAFHETAISPDGRRVAWVEEVSAAEATTAIYVRDDRAPSRKPHASRRRTTAAAIAKTASRGRRTAARSRFCPTPAPGQLQLYVIDVDGRRTGASRVDQRQGSARAAAAGRRTASSRRPVRRRLDAGHRRPRRLQARRRRRRRDVRGAADRRSSTRDRRRARRSARPNMYVYDYDWSPDGKAFAAEAVEGSGDQQLVDRAALRRCAPTAARRTLDLEAAAADRRAALVARRQVDRLHPRPHERRGLDRRRHLRRAGGAAARATTSRRTSKARRARSSWRADGRHPLHRVRRTAERRSRRSTPPAARSHHAVGGAEQLHDASTSSRRARDAAAARHAVVPAGARGLRRARSASGSR